MNPQSFRNQRSIWKLSFAVALFYFLTLSIFFQSFAVYAASYEALSRPWSGYWWPYAKGGLGTGLDYRGRPAPLEKYNLLMTGVTSGTALSWYLDRYYDPKAPGWYGLCAYWARAACWEHMEIFPSSENNIIFRVGDKKGLLTLAHNSDPIVAADGSRPEEFHAWLLNYIKDQRKAFVADLDAGTEVWSYPIYKYEMESSRQGNIESVRVRIYYADDFVKPDYMGTQVRRADYTYDLFLDGDGAIDHGEWTGGSISYHPDRLSFSLYAHTSCPDLDYEEILRLAGSRDDFLEKGSATVEIGPGTYNLILLDEDVYTMSSVAGDVLSVQIEKKQGSSQDIDVVVVDGNGDKVQSGIVSDDVPMSILLTSATPPYRIRLTQDNYADPNIYTLKADLKKSYNQEAPYIPKAGEWWSGFALTNPGSAGVDGVTLTTRNKEGNPIRTVLGPLRLGPGEKRVFFFSDLPGRLHELVETERLTLTANGPVDLLNLIGEGNNSLATFVQGDARGSRLVIPDTARPMTPGVRMFGGVRNESFEEARVTLRLFSGEGKLLKEVSETISARGWLGIEPDFYPFYSMPESGWIEILGDGKHVLSGFQYTSNASGVETLFALPVGSSKKIVPHVPPPGYWTTRVTLINPNKEWNSVKLHPALAGADSTGDLDILLAPREKRVLEIQNSFGKMAGEPLYHSILEITGLYPLVGYFTYSVPNGNDNASYPLPDDTYFKSTLSLPHYPGNDGYWWTGICVCNPSSFAVKVRIEPYDSEGNLMEESVIYLNLDAGAYDVFEVAYRFGEVASRISFIKFCSEGPGGAIGGFYLYSNSGDHILSGANM